MNQFQNFDTAISQELNKLSASSLDNATTAAQMAKALSEKDWPDARLIRLRDAIDSELANKAEQRAKRDQLQNFKLSILQLAKEYGISFSEIVAIMKGA